MPAEIKFSERKFKDLLLYAAKQLADDPTFGETKLNKVLFFSDVEAYRILGKPITGAEYQKNRYGPTARRYPVMRDDLLRRGQIKVERRMVVDHVQDVVKLDDIEPYMPQFSSQEISIVDNVIAEMRHYNNTETSDLSHERSAGWWSTKLFETIPYETWLIDPEPADAEALSFLRKAEGLKS